MIKKLNKDKEKEAARYVTDITAPKHRFLERLTHSAVTRMTATVLYLILFLNISSALADDEVPRSGTCNDAGTCLWSLNSDGTMNISAAINPDTGKAYENVVMKNYVCADSTGIGNRPWEQNIKQIKYLVVGDNIKNIGNEAFQYALNLQTVTGMKDVENIGFDTFANATQLNLIETPSVEILDNYALAGTNLTSIDLPKIRSIGAGSLSIGTLQYAGLPENTEINIRDSAFTNSIIPDCSNENRAACGSCGTSYVKRGIGCVSDCGAGYLGKEGHCIDADSGCGENYKQIETWCNRIRYTPAEAAQYLKDTDNEIIMTFKVNR